MSDTSSTEAQVRRAPNPQAALIAIAQALDKLLEVQQSVDGGWGWSDPDPMVRIGDSVAPRSAWEGHVGGREALMRVESDEDTTTINIARPSPEKFEARQIFEAQVLRLGQAFGDPVTDFNDVYAKGGPLWLYNYDRDFVMSLPFDIKQQMVADIEEDDPRIAIEVGRDLLKFAGETGPGSPAMKIGEGDIG